MTSVLEVAYFDGHTEGFNLIITKRQALFGWLSLECWLMKILQTLFGVGIQVKVVGL